MQSFFLRITKTLIRCTDVQADLSHRSSLGARVRRYVSSHCGSYLHLSTRKLHMDGRKLGVKYAERYTSTYTVEL